MQKWPEVIRHGKFGRVLRVQSRSNKVEYLVMSDDPEKRRRFDKPEQAIDYLTDLERDELHAQSRPKRSFGRSLLERAWPGHASTKAARSRPEERTEPTAPPA
jgi:hypothetical protein